MKIVIDITSTQDQFANRGIGTYTRELVSRLVEMGRGCDEFFLLAFDSDTTLAGVMKANRKYVSRVSLGPLAISGVKNNFTWWFQYLPAIKKVISQHNPDLYFCPYFWRGFPANLMPTIVTIHDFALPVLGRYSQANPVFDLVRKFQYYSTLRHVEKAAGVIVGSKNAGEDLVKYADVSNVKLSVVYHGISDRFKMKSPDREVLLKYLPLKVVEQGYICYYGGVEENKNVPAVVMGYAQLVKTWGEGSGAVPFLVLGGGHFMESKFTSPGVSEVKSLIDELGLKGKVFYTGFFSDDDAVDLLCGSMMFTHLSVYEGFGLAALEAMKCGVPVVASNRSCYPEVLGEGALLVDPEDTLAVARAYARVLTDAEFARDLSKKGVNSASRYCWDKSASQTYKFFETIYGKTK